jgi:hypothetical protein
MVRILAKVDYDGYVLIALDCESRSLHHYRNNGYLVGQCPQFEIPWQKLQIDPANDQAPVSHPSTIEHELLELPEIAYAFPIPLPTFQIPIITASFHHSQRPTNTSQKLKASCPL